MREETYDIIYIYLIEWTFDKMAFSERNTFEPKIIWWIMENSPLSGRGERSCEKDEVRCTTLEKGVISKSSYVILKCCNPIDFPALFLLILFNWKTISVDKILNMLAKQY